MFKALFNIILDLLATVVQLVCYPINELIDATLPDLSSQINTLVGSLSQMFGNLSWIVDILPSTFLNILLFIITIEISKHTIYVSSHGIVKIWNLFQKLKFW